MIALLLDLAAPTWRTLVLFLTSKTSVTRLSGFLALHFFTIMRGSGDIGMLSINLSGVETIYVSILALMTLPPLDFLYGDCKRNNTLKSIIPTGSIYDKKD